VVTNGAADNASVLFGNGSGSFAPKLDVPTGDNPSSVAIAELDADGTPYLIVTNQYSNSVSLVRSNLDGTFAPRSDVTVGSNPTSVVARDLDLDGLPDLAVANSGSSSLSVFRRLPNGGLGPRIDYRLASGPKALTAGDLDGDGYPDLVACLANGKAAVLLNRGVTPTVAVEDPVPLSVPRVRLHPNPTRGPVTVSLALERPATVRIELLDVAGRRIASRDLGFVLAGGHQVRIENGRPLPAGVYLVRVATGSRVSWARVVVLQ
jgi:hypothetical protein